MKAPLFAIITPTYHSGAKIAATITSVLSQEPGLYEYVVIDGASTDDTLDYVRPHGQALRWSSEPDAGIYDAMNKGIRLTRGRFLYFLGAGDCLRPGVLRAAADALAGLGATDRRPREFIYGDVHWSGVRYGGAFDARRLMRQNINHQGIFYGRGIFDLLGEYSLRYKICADYALNILCFGRPDIRKIHLDLVVADFEGGGISDTIDRVFFAWFPWLAWRSLGFRQGLRAWFYHARYLPWARWLHYHLRQPWHTWPTRLRRWRQILAARRP